MRDMNTTKPLPQSSRNFQKIIPCAVFVFVTLPVIAFAATSLVPCGNPASNGNPAQPACDFNALATLVNNIINWFLAISVSVAAITIAIAGGTILFNPDNAAKRTEALEMLKKTIYGIIIILVAWLVIHTVIAALTNTPKSGSGVGPLKFLGN